MPPTLSNGATTAQPGSDARKKITAKVVVAAFLKAAFVVRCMVTPLVESLTILIPLSRITMRHDTLFFFIGQCFRNI
ncbi:hypothetical protein [Pseudodesulfovibrio sp.]|uniref:hypothetical protein n=1 Tax=Pseudodesulfovibrio sp. TaxID=2035812 RepID=UPI002627B16F|nr:hypothetical protein [Pseudodesulfovibrio sp.]MDD3312289.1 hypothetical protein [Pseudodesulfovibrio sp.]